MPELPEVEEVRRTLEPYILGQRITSLRVLRKDFVTGGPVGRVKGHRFTHTLRHGKKLFLVLEDGQTLLIHLGMSGRIDVVARGAPVESHTHVIIGLESGQEVRHRDPRRFGGLWYYTSEGAALAAEVTDRMGPDALMLTAADLGHWATARGKLKARLLGQKDVAGLGNIYVDEALWMARLHPLQFIHRIRPEQIAVLVKAVHEVLAHSLSVGGTTLRDYRNVSDQPGAFARRLQAYGRGGQACLRCGATLRTIQVTARTTVFCPVCQRRR